MEIKLSVFKFLHKFILVIILFLVFTAPVYSESSDFFMELRFIQRLRWSGDEYASRYEIIIELITETKIETEIDTETVIETLIEYNRVYHEFTNEYSIEISLPPGKYRYQVIPYDYLDRQVTGSGWIEFEIFSALNPELDDILMEYIIYETHTEMYLHLTGKNLDMNAGISLRGFDGSFFSPDDIQISQNGSSAKILFYDIDALPEIFMFIVRNPSGLETRLEAKRDVLIENRIETIIEPEIDPEEFIVEIEEIPLPEPAPRIKKTDPYLSAAILPLYPLYGNMNWLSVSQDYLPGYSARLGFVSKKQDALLNFGFEATGTLLDFDTIQTLMLDINLLLQKRSQSGRSAVIIKAGAGYNFIQNISEITNISDWQPFHIQFGGTFLWFFWRQLYLETGIDFVYWTINGENSSCLRPMIGLGLRFR
jgi:hypothetical protein